MRPISLFRCLAFWSAGFLVACLPAAEFTAEPLAPASGPVGSTRFTRLPPAETGIVTENRYADPRIWMERYHEFAIGAIGTGVAVGDYDGDGRPDLYVVSKTESGRLFRNLGGWKFEDVTARAGLLAEGAAAREWKQGVAFADVNNDGRLDLYVCRHAVPNLLYVNQGNGTFREEAAGRGLAVNDASGMAAFCDYDLDGWLDVYIQTNVLDASAQPPGRRDYLFRNNGDGTYVDVSAVAGIRGEAQGHSVTWWDFDADGRPDIYVANDFMVPDVLYRNNGDGTFTDVIDAVLPVIPYHAMGSDLGDFNNDGRLDLFVADMARSSVQRDRATIADTRARSRLGAAPSSAAQIMRNTLFLATGTGHCLEGAALAGLSATDWTWSVRAEDLDNDGRVDLHVTNGMVRDYDNVDVRMRTMAAESSAERVRLMRQSPPAADRNLVYRNLGDLRFEEVGAAWGLDDRGVSFGAAMGDFDGDGDLDMVHGNYMAGVTVLRNDGRDGHRLVVVLRGIRSNRFGLGAVVRVETASGTQVRQLVSARGYLSTSEPIVHFGLGEETVVSRLTVEWPGGATQEFRDIAAGQRVTITEPSHPSEYRPVPSDVAPLFTEVSRQVGLEDSPGVEETGEGPEQPFVSVRHNQRARSLATGDLDGDGLVDLVLGGTSRHTARWWRGGSDGTWTPAPALPMGGELPDGPIVIFDANGDGRNDLLIAKGGDAALPESPAFQMRLLLNEGERRFQPAQEALPSLSVSVGALVVADFNRDGWPDVFVGGRQVPGQYPLGPRSALLLNRKGRFEDATANFAPGLGDGGMVTAALATDLDSDGWSDLLLATDWGPVRGWLNRDGRALEEATSSLGFDAAGTGWWRSLAEADFNNDGRPDYVVGNAGLNTPYRASVDRPALLYYGDFGGNGPLALEAEWDDDRIVPRATRGQLGSRLPSVRSRFPRNEAFARATLAEIVGPETLSTAGRWSATELQSGVFLSQPDGTRRFTPLPRVAQIAPGQGAVAGDFDGDGHADIYVVQNSFAPVIRVGRFSGGLSQLLLGNGKGLFVPVEPEVSGLVVPGEAGAVVAVGIGERQSTGFIVVRHGAPMLVFRPQARSR